LNPERPSKFNYFANVQPRKFVPNATFRAKHDVKIPNKKLKSLSGGGFTEELV
jgi:hypothetical protein